jgi:hypothetical protein
MGSFLGMGCMVPQPFAAEANRSYLEFGALTSGPRYPGYITLTRSFGLERARLQNLCHCWFLRQLLVAHLMTLGVGSSGNSLTVFALWAVGLNLMSVVQNSKMI